MESENISAISTALVASGVAVIRISGDSPLEIAQKMFKPCSNIAVKDFEPNKMYVGEIEADGFSDHGMCVYFKAPKSFTGEDVIEFHTHGGIAITKGILRKILSLGARLANNGEFTKRAFMNGKLSLSSAEGLIDMINSESVSGVKAGYYLYREKLTSEITAMQELITDALAEIDADMDFPEEDLEITSTANVKVALDKVIDKITALMGTYRLGRTLKDGVKVAICGKPNTGKSSTLNALLNYEKAIVSDIPGTTRDVVEGNLDINGVRFYFADTAGIRDNAESVEELGIGLSKRILKESDVIVMVVESQDFDDDENKIYSLIKDENHIIVQNKSDKNLGKNAKADIMISALKKDNLESLKQLIYDKTIGSGIDINGDFLCEERHYLALERAMEKFKVALNAIDCVPLDILAIDIKDGWDALGEISGKTATEDIIDDIFSKFCVGK